MPAYNQHPAPPSSTPLPDSTSSACAFTLPDLTPATFHTPNESTLLFSLGSISDPNSKVSPCFKFEQLEKKAKVSLHGLVNEDRAEFERVWLIKKDGQGERNQEMLWSAIYACELFV